MIGATEQPFAGRVALVTGGGTGIGARVSSVLAERGAAVVVVQPDERSAGELAAKLAADGRDVRGIGEDLSSAAACLSAVERCVALHGGIDILVNNAAVVGDPARGDLLGFADERLDAIIDVNVKAVFRCSRNAARHMTERGGVIVNVASVGAFAAQDRSSAYVASKAAVIGMTRGMAFELAPHGIRVVAVAPGDIDIGADGPTLTGSAYFAPPASWWERKAPIGRRGTPDDIARAVAFLASEEARYVTGQTLVVDGGWLSY